MGIKPTHSSKLNVILCYFTIIALSSREINASSYFCRNLDGKEVGRGSSLSQAQIAGVDSEGTIIFSGREIQVIEEVSQPAFTESEMPTVSDKGCAKETTLARPEELKYRPSVIDNRVFKPFSAPLKFGAPLPHSDDVVNRISSVPPLSHLADSLVLPRPPFDHYDYDVDGIVDLTVDRHLSKHLRPHQREGVIFLYKCVMGFNSKGKACVHQQKTTTMSIVHSFQENTLEPFW